MSVTKRTIVITRRHSIKYLNSNVYFNSPTYRRVSLHMTRRSLTTTILNGGIIFHNYDFNDRMLLFLIRKNINLAIPKYYMSHVALGTPLDDIELFNFYRHVLSMRRVHDLLSSQHFTMVRLPSHPLTREGYEDHISELDLVTSSSNPELALENDYVSDPVAIYDILSHEATYLGSFNAEVSHRQLLSGEWWVTARDISEAYKSISSRDRDYIYEHFDELFPQYLRDTPTEITFMPQGTIYDPFSQPGLATERLLQEAFTADNLETIQAIHDTAHLAAAFLS